LGLEESIIEDPSGTDVVRVFVGDEHPVNAGVSNSGRVQSSENLPGGESAVDEDSTPAVADIGAVASGA
jgi:hypothetical protein